MMPFVQLKGSCLKTFREARWPHANVQQQNAVMLGHQPRGKTLPVSVFDVGTHTLPPACLGPENETPLVEILQ